MADNNFGLTDEQVARNKAAGGADLSITADKLGVTESPIDLPQAQETPVPVLTALEKEAQGITEKANEAKTELLGEQSFRSNLEQDLTDETAEVTAARNAFNELVAEQKAIPLQIQQESEGRGRTVGGVQPLQTARNRDVAIRGLFAQSRLQAAQGNLAEAKASVDKAVAAKFDPIRQELATQLLQLEIITPRLVGEQKQRAEAQKARIKAEEKRVEREAKDDEQRLKSINEASALGIDTDILQKAILEDTYEGALAVLAPALSALAQTDKKAEQLLKSLTIQNIESQIQDRKDSMKLKASTLAETIRKNKAEEAADREAGLKLTKAEQKELKEEEQALKDEAEGAIGLQTLINDLLNDPVRKRAVGGSSIWPSFPGSQLRNFNLTHQQLKDSLTRDNLSALRGLGAMSERELALIEKSSTKLSLDLPEDKYEEELQKIATNLESTFAKAIELGAVPVEDVALSMGLDTSDLIDLTNLGVFDTVTSTQATI